MIAGWFMGLKLTRLLILFQKKLLPSATLHRQGDWLELSDNSRYGFIAFFCAYVMVSAFFFSSLKDIVTGYRQIITAPSVLITDYMTYDNKTLSITVFRHR